MQGAVAECSGAPSAQALPARFWGAVPQGSLFCGGSGLFGPGFRAKPAWRAYVHFAGGRAR